MPSERFFVHKEDGSLVRLKGRLVRFLDEEPPTGSDKSAIRTALEVSPDAEGLVQADVGSSPHQIPVNGMLGDMAYQSSEGISVARAEVESTTGTGSTQALTVTDGSSTNFVVQEDGKVGVGTGTLASGATLDVNGAMAIGGTRVFSKSSTDLNVGSIDGSPAINTINLKTADTVRAVIDSSGNMTLNSGNLVLSSGAIDFGSAAAAGRTVESGLLDDYEEGSFTAEYVPQTGSFATMTMDFRLGRYTKVGNTVHFVIYMMTSNVDVTGASDSLIIRGLPFSAANHSGNYVPPVYVGDAVLWPNPYTPVGGYIYPNSKDIYLVRRSTSSSDTALLSASTMTTGAVAFANRIMVAGTYEAA